MTTIKLDSKLPANGVPDDLAQSMWDSLGSRHMAIVEVRVGERTEPADSLDTDPSAKIRVTSIEFASDSQDDERLRQAMRDRWAARTAADTLEDQGTWRERTNPDTSFQEGLLAHLADRGQLGGYPIHVELQADGSLTINVGAEKVEPAEPEAEAGADQPGPLDDIPADDRAVLAAAAELVINTQHGSPSMLQRKLKVTAEKAGQLIDQLEELGVVSGPLADGKSRDVLITADDLDSVIGRLAQVTADEPELVST